MYSWDVLPAASLTSAGLLTAEFIARGISDFRAAGRYLQELPYGRTIDRENFAAVLREGKGTCSTKHALLAAVAREQGISVVLTLGIYEMHERNTPGLGRVLDRYGLRSIPEAHCYLIYGDKRIDITRSGIEPTGPIAEFLHEEVIFPEQIGDYKVTLHRQFMQQWINSKSATIKGRTCDELWRIREECIAALAQ